MIRFSFKAIAAVALIALMFWEWRFLESRMRTASHPRALPNLRGAQPGVSALKPVEIDLTPSILQGRVQVGFKGNGREKMVITVSNQSDRSIGLKVPEGQTFVTAGARVILVRACNITVNPGETVQQEMQSAALSSVNQVASAVFTPSDETIPKLNELLVHLKYHPEVSAPAIQTAVLALIENLPAGAFAKFTRPGAPASLFDTTAFRVDTTDLIAALMMLRNIGVPDSLLAITVDPQLKSEAMIDPLAHASAMQYYKIPFQNEWGYWKKELLQGDPALRHYALYGIARFFPEVALQMLPRWVRAKQLSPVYRQSALQAIVETGRIEAISVLNQFEHEFGTGNDLGRNAHLAAEYLGNRLNQEPPAPLVAYRTTRAPSLRQPSVVISVVAFAN